MGIIPPGWTFSAFKTTKNDLNCDIKFIEDSNNPNLINVFSPNDLDIGQIFRGEEGDFEFWPVLRGGYWPSYGMRQIADKLDSLNKINKEENNV